MRPLIDTNVLLDVAVMRPGLHAASSAVVVWCKNHPGAAAVTAHSLATVYYLARRAGGPKLAREFIGDLVVGFDVAPLGNAEINRALELAVPDFEDAMLAAVAESCAASVIVTRNLSDFRKSPVKAVSPEGFMKLAAS